MKTRNNPAGAAWLETARLRLRPPCADDAPAFSALMRDTAAADSLRGVLDAAAARRRLDRQIQEWASRGYGKFAVIEKRSGRWIGRAGPSHPRAEDELEVGWAVLPAYWGRGFATEAASAAMSFAFDHCGADRVFHYIAPSNAASRSVARKLGSVDSGRTADLSGLNAPVNVWSQCRENWRANRKRFTC